MSEMTLRQHSDEIVFMRAKVEMLESVEIPYLKDAWISCVKDGRLASACGTQHLIHDLERDVEAYQRCIDLHLTVIAKGE